MVIWKEIRDDTRRGKRIARHLLRTGISVVFSSVLLFSRYSILIITALLLVIIHGSNSQKAFYWKTCQIFTLSNKTCIFIYLTRSLHPRIKRSRINIHTLSGLFKIFLTLFGSLTAKTFLSCNKDLIQSPLTLVRCIVNKKHTSSCQ